MSEPHSDARVFFGATGDLAHKKIFPSLQAMLKRGHLSGPVIGVAEPRSAQGPGQGQQRRPRHRREALVRGQFRGYRKETGVAPDSKVETFAALRLRVDSWGWKGVPFYIRAGKCLPVTCTEIVVRLRQPPTMYQGFDLKPNYCRMRISPDIAIAVGTNVIAPGQEMVSACSEMLASRHPRADEMDAYERVLGDAMARDATLFAREDYVEEAWRIVDPALKAATPVSEYAPGTWGPPEVDQSVAPPGGWQNPAVTS